MDQVGAKLGQDKTKLGQVGVKLGQIWSKDGPSWSQVEARLDKMDEHGGQDGQVGPS